MHEMMSDICGVVRDVEGTKKVKARSERVPNLGDDIQPNPGLCCAAALFPPCIMLHVVGTGLCSHGSCCMSSLLTSLAHVGVSLHGVAGGNTA